MKLYTAHMILMGSAVVGCASYALWAGVRLMNQPSVLHGLVLGGALVVTIGVALYLRAFVRRIRALAAQSPQEP